MEQNTETVVLPVGITKRSVSSATLSQKDATYNAVHEVSAKYNVSIVEIKENKSTDARLARKEVAKILKSLILAGSVKLTSEKSDAQLNAYCSGLINNWLKKDSRFKS